MRSRVAPVAGLILVLSICGSRVDAAPDDDSEARSHYAAALQHIVRGAHDEALHELQASYALAPYPGTLYRIAQCEDLLGRTDEAIADYRRFAETAKNPTRRAAALARVEALKLATAAAKARAAPPATVGTVTAPAPATQLAARLPPPSAPRPLHRRWWLWTGVGVAVVAVGLGVGLGVGLQPRIPDAHFGTVDPL